MKKGRYYAVLASSGAFVHPCYDRAAYCRDRYFRPPCIIKKFPSAMEALAAAQEHLWEVIPSHYELPPVLEVNVFYTPKSLSRKEVAE